MYWTKIFLTAKTCHSLIDKWRTRVCIQLSKYLNCAIIWILRFSGNVHKTRSWMCTFHHYEKLVCLHIKAAWCPFCKISHFLCHQHLNLKCTHCWWSLRSHEGLFASQTEHNETSHSSLKTKKNTSRVWITSFLKYCNEEMVMKICHSSVIPVFSPLIFFKIIHQRYWASSVFSLYLTLHWHLRFAGKMEFRTNQIAVNLNYFQML